MKPIFLIMAALLIVGCVPQPTSMSGGWSSQRSVGRTVVQVEDSAFEPSIRFLGIEDRFDVGVSLAQGESYRNLFIRSWLNRQTGAVSHQLYWSIIYRDFEWRFYNRVNDEQARSLNFTSIDRTVISCAGGARSGLCSYSEVVGADVDDAVMRAAVRENRNYCVRVFARSGVANTLCLSTTMMREQLAAIDQRRPTPQRRPASPSRPSTPTT